MVNSVLQTTPVLKIVKVYKDYNGNYVERDKAWMVSVEAYDKDDNLILNTGGIGEGNK